MRLSEAAVILPSVGRSKKFQLVRLQRLHQTDAASYVMLLRVGDTDQHMQITKPDEWPPELPDSLP